MNRDNRLVAELMSSTEVRKVEFKRDQYRLDNEKLKSDFIKDILCIANAPGDDGYILLGVKAEKGKPREVTGISHHHDGSDLEQMVNSVIDEPIQFEYRVVACGGKECAILHIPKSKARPHWPRKDYGILRKHVFYTRRSSGNREASIQEVREMCISTIHISDIAQRKIKSSSHIVDELLSMDLDEREAAMHRMFKTIAPKIGLTRHKSMLSPSSSRHSCSLVRSEGRKVAWDYAVFMYPWTAGRDDIVTSRRNATNLGLYSTRGKYVRKSTVHRLSQSTLIHVSYKGISTKSLISRYYNSSYSFANEWKPDWGRVMKWEDTARTYVRSKVMNEDKAKYEFFLPDVSSKDELQERLGKLLIWVDENVSSE